MSLHISNTLTGTKEAFKPIDERHVRLYVCGPTVYNKPHIGNGRPVVVFDVLYRLLKTLYPKVTYVRNITDVDDKIHSRAFELGIAPSSLARQITEVFHGICDFLGALPPTHEPRVTDHMDDIIAMIQKLLDNGAAYEAEGHVLFRVSAAKNYGALARKDEEAMLAGARVDVASYKENPQDFVLWKPSKKFDSAWDAPFGKGRPGWHIECSAMAHKYLGEVFDIHGGGIDLIFPHHENEIAQSTCAHGTDTLANYWMHNGHLQIDGAKMAKSMGNVVTFDDVMRAHRGDVVRVALLQSHYKQPLNWTEQSLHMAKSFMDKYYRAMEKVPSDEYSSIVGHLAMPAVKQALLDDLNTPQVFSILNKAFETAEIADLISTMKFMGLGRLTPQKWFQNLSSTSLSEDIVRELISQRAEAKQARQFERADKIRQLLFKEGVILDDTRDGTRWRVR